MQIVNGYVCQTSCDVSAARAGHDPKNPRNDPIKARLLDEQKALTSGRPLPEDPNARVDAVTFGGSLARPSTPKGAAAAMARLVDRLA